jgi:hypothetical protein
MKGNFRKRYLASLAATAFLLLSTRANAYEFVRTSADFLEAASNKSPSQSIGDFL